MKVSKAVELNSCVAGISSLMSSHSKARYKPLCWVVQVYPSVLKKTLTSFDSPNGDGDEATC